MFKSTPQSQGYELAPPPYEAESSRRFSTDDEEVGEDMFKDTVANSSVEIRMRKMSKEEDYDILSYLDVLF